MGNSLSALEVVRTGAELFKEFRSMGIIGRTIKAIQTPSHCAPFRDGERNPWPTVGCEFLKAQKDSAEWFVICIFGLLLFGFILGKILVSRIQVHYEIITNRSTSTSAANQTSVCNPVTIIDMDENERMIPETTRGRGRVNW